MARMLIRSAFADLGQQRVAESITQTVKGLQDVLSDLNSRAARTVPGPVTSRTALPADAWSLPDAIWTAACRKQPRLRQYPLGESCERAAKRILVALLFKKGGSLPIKKRQLKNRLAAAAALSHKVLTKRFLGELFFEICIDRLRRPGRFAYGYDFAANGRAVSLHGEWKSRDRLAKQCFNAANKFLRNFGTASQRRLRKLKLDRVGEASEKVSGVRPSSGPETSGERWINVLSGPIARELKVAQRKFSVAKRPTRMLLHDHSPYSVSFSFEPFESYLGRRLDSRVRDLLDLGVAVYISDLHTHRDHELARHTGLLLSVRHPELWKDSAEVIERIVSYLGRDDFRVFFTKRREATQKRPLQVSYEGRCVCLLSGGLDSLAGVVWAFTKGLRPILVSHHARGQLSAIQKGLRAELERRFGEIEHVCFYASKHQKKGTAKGKAFNLGTQRASMMAQYQRSFLFLSAATAVALEKGIRHVYVFENGPVALNPSICEGRVNTQTAHPHVLAEFRRLISKVFGVQLEIQNPFAYLTKGEVLRHLGHNGLRDAIAKTDSCWGAFNVQQRAGRLGIGNSQATHDGTCLPCILRRVAVEAAALSRFDAPYLVDVFRSYPNLDFDTTLAVADLLRFCRTVNALPDADLLKRVPELSVYEESTDCRKLAAMLRNHAKEVRGAFSKRANAAFKRDFGALL